LPTPWGQRAPAFQPCDSSRIDSGIPAFERLQLALGPRSRSGAWPWCWCTPWSCRRCTCTCRGRRRRRRWCWCRGRGRRRRSRWCWSRCSAPPKIELADPRVPVAILGILVDMPEVHAVGRIDFCPRVITPARPTSLGSDSRKHDGFSLRKITWRVTDQPSGITNRRDDCRVGSRITDDRVSTLIGGYAGHPPPQTVVAVGPVLLLSRRSREIAAGNIELIPAHRSRAARVIQEINMTSP